MDIPWMFLCGYLLFLCILQANGECKNPLGMQVGMKASLGNKRSKHIADKQITSSSDMSTVLAAKFARLGMKMSDSSEKIKITLGGWCSGDSDAKPHIQVDLLQIHTISKLVTQGVEQYDSWVTQYMVQFSMDGSTWYDYKEDGQVKNFKGNVNTGVPMTSVFNTPITARFIRVVALKKHHYFCLRMELYGCEPKEDCRTPVGMEDRRIPDYQITASSHWNDHKAANARLRNKFRLVNGKLVWGGWCTDKKDVHQYLQIDLGHVRAVSGVTTQGYIVGSFVRNYKMNYSLDGQEWKEYAQHGARKTLSGNWDNETLIKSWWPRIFARFIRLNPVSWNSMGYICMRVEIYECLPSTGSVPIVSPPGASYKVNRTSSLNVSCLISGQENFAFAWMKNGIAVGNTSYQTTQRWKLSNGKTQSILSLRDIKYRDSGSVISCTAWYPGLAINTSRNVHVFVNAARPTIKVAKLESRSATIGVMDPASLDTLKYLIRYKPKDTENVPWTTIQRVRPAVKKSSTAYITISNLNPYTPYLTEVSSFYKDDDVGPYSVPLSFTTDQDVPTGPPRDVLVEPASDGHIIVSWSVLSYEKRNGRIIKYEVTFQSQTMKPKSLFTKHLQKDIKGLQKDQRYEIIVRAFTRVGPGPYSKTTVYSTETDDKPKSKTTLALEKLSKVTVTTRNAAKVTATVQNLTNTKDHKLVAEDVHMTSSILSRVVSTNISSVKVGDNLLKTISNVMGLNTETLYKTHVKYNTSATFVKVLENFIEKGGKFSVSTENVAVRQQKIKARLSSMRTSFTAKDNKIQINSTTSGSGPSGDASIKFPATAFPNNDMTNETVIFVYYRSSKLFAPNFHRVVVCENGFTSNALQKVENKGSTYTVERVTDRKTITKSSPVIAASLKGRQVVNLTQPVTIMFKLPPEMIERNHTKCVWWDFNAEGGRGNWSTAGCDLLDIINDTIICECNHMTNFAALVDVYGPSSKPCGKHELVLSWIAYIGCTLSILGLMLTVFTYGFFAKLRKEIAAKVLLHLCTALLCVLIVFVAGVDHGVKSRLICQVVAVLMHYFLLVAFMWMFFEAYFMYFAFVKVWNDHGDYILWKCASIAWGLPAVVVVVTIVVDRDSYGGEHYCRLTGLPFFLAFLAPVVLIIVFNTIIFTIIMYKLSVRPSTRSADKDRGREGLLQLRRAFGILILVGLTWMFGFFAVSSMRLIFTYTFAVFNCLQGFSIFVFYCVTQRNVRDCWMALLRCDLQSLNKKNIFTESYDPKTKTYLDTMRPRAKSEPAKGNTLQKEKFRPRMHTADVKFTVHEKENRQPAKMSSDNPNYDNSTYVTVTIEPPPHESACEEFEMASRPGSRSGSLRSHEAWSRDSNNKGSRGTVNSNESTPKLFRMPRFKVGSSISALSSGSKSPHVSKNTLKRTTSHTPEAPKQYTPLCLRRTQSAMSLGKENRISGESLISFASTSSESLSTDSQGADGARNPETRRLLTLSRLDPNKYGELIISPQRGSVRGIVGHVETNVDTYDDLIENPDDRKRSVSLPAHAYSYIFQE